MEKSMVYQDYEGYLDEDHQTWSTLMKRQHLLNADIISREYLLGYQQLNLDTTSIVKIEELSRRLESLSGWTLTPVTGLIPTKDFFYMLINKKYPVTVSIRRPYEIDFSEQPDIFHDVCGHLPMLVNDKFTRFLTAYSTIALKYVNNDRAIDLLGRLYWYTYEMGIIYEDEKYKPYGGAVITSSEEIKNVSKIDTPKYPFELQHIFKTAYNPYKLQNEYFVINSFDDLFESLTNIEVDLIENLLLPHEDLVLRNYTLNNNLGKGFNNVIGFLNDIQFKFPNAVSFVAGQPDERFFEIQHHLSGFDTYVQHMASETGKPAATIINKIGQYGKTKGIVNDIVSRYLKKDENINISGDNILITVGAQEAFSIIVSTICNRDEDVILVEDPSYIGLSSFSRLFDYHIEGVYTNEEGIDIQDLRNKIIRINRTGKKIKLLYVIPDYQNPTGCCMPIGNRLKLLELARKYNFLIIEDSVYNSFTYEQKKNPTLKSLDKYNRVIYVGSFSKSLFPGLRIGLIGAEQQVENDNGEVVPLIDEMAKVKAQITNNTPTINQAILGGILLELDYSLHEWCKQKFESYKAKRDSILSALDHYVEAYRDTWAAGISWNKPDGGFFIKMSLPFEVNNQTVWECVSKFNVIFCPMRYFYLKEGGENEVRLAFSNLSMEEIESGIQRLAAFLKFKVNMQEQVRQETRQVDIIHS
ncbi:MAG TPA: aminotransferase class I/II-fold pyridoxal phosphate-dependent enzyme [Puia sp.]|jgi:(S)-3,5-dihydroxyphenylglycine transaminase|nr:aminotransferase class I/II-fold pyridoxal phosphate-dependent enzyme [Puia sp.]